MAIRFHTNICSGGGKERYSIDGIFVLRFE